MGMIKRGNSDSTKPSVISISLRCTKCGHFEQNATGSVTCPKCQCAMTESKSAPAGDSCPGGVCSLDK